MQECESHASVHSCELLVEVFEIPMKRNVVNLFSTLILNKDDRYCRQKELSPGLSLYLLRCKHFSVRTDNCFLQQNKSFGFDLQYNLELIIAVQNSFKWYAQLITLIILL